MHDYSCVSIRVLAEAHRLIFHRLQTQRVVSSIDCIEISAKGCNDLSFSFESFAPLASRQNNAGMNKALLQLTRLSVR